MSGAIYVNGKIWTANPAQPEAEAVAMEGDRIAAVGSNTEMRALAGPSTQIVDLGGRRMLPAFNDAHVHFLNGGAMLCGAQLAGAGSLAEFQRRIADFAKMQPHGAWLRNGNWDHQLWTPAEAPNHKQIDGACGEHPALLWRHDGHMALANALALKLAGIDRHTPDPPGGAIERDRDGEPTGILKDAATALVERVMAPLTSAEKRNALRAAMRAAAAHGVASVQNMADTSEDAGQPALLREFERLLRDGELTVRIYQSLPVRDWRTLAGAGIEAPFGGPWLRLGNLKAFSDGAIGSATAWMAEPYTNQPEKNGLASRDLLDLENFYEALRAADRARLQLSIHAIGDRANAVILDLYERLAEENGLRDRRLRIEHAQHLRREDFARFARFDVIASMQPYHAIDDGRWAEGVIGAERCRRSFAWRSLLDAGARLAFGSDWPVAPLDPLLGVYAAVTRSTLDGKHPGGWFPEQRVTTEEALRAYTLGAAYAEGQETIKGSIEPGKLADLVVLSDDLFAIAPEEIAKCKVDLTIVGGRTVYQREG